MRGVLSWRKQGEEMRSSQDMSCLYLAGSHAQPERFIILAALDGCGRPSISCWWWAGLRVSRRFSLIRLGQRKILEASGA